MSRCVIFLATFLLLFVSDQAPALAWSCKSPAWGFGAGATATSSDGFDDPSWVGDGSFECFGNDRIRPRGTLGIANLEGDPNGIGGDATYGFLTGGIMFGRVASGVATLGVYHVTLDAPIVPETSRQLEFGYNGGVRFLLPMGHDAGVTFEALFHRVRGDGPNNLFTFTVGLFGW
jgi:hypothetical protein